MSPPGDDDAWFRSGGLATGWVRVMDCRRGVGATGRQASGIRALAEKISHIGVDMRLHIPTRDFQKVSLL